MPELFSAIFASDLVAQTSFLQTCFEAVAVPILAACALITIASCHGPFRRAVEVQFFLTLAFVMVVTCHTIVLCGECWLIHTTTLATMIVAALVMPAECPIIQACQQNYQANHRASQPTNLRQLPIPAKA